jgi:cell shape-determining protein MreC
MQTKEKKYFRNNLILILIFIFFFLSFSKIKSFFNSSTQDKSTPESFLSLINNGIENSFGFFSDIGGYFISKAALQNQVADLENQLESQKYYSIIDSSTSLESLPYSSTSSTSSNANNISKTKNILNKDLPVVAKKIFSDFTSIYDTVLLDKGFSSGVEKGDIVFLYPNQIIGQIDSINPNTSLLTLYSKDKNKIEGVMKVFKNNSKTNFADLKNQNSSSSIISSASSSLPSASSSLISIETNPKQKNESNVLIDLFGNGGGDFVATLPDNLDVSTGTIIYLSNDESKALGEVVKVEKQDASFYETIMIKGYYNSRLNDSYYIMHK